MSEQERVSNELTILRERTVEYHQTEFGVLYKLGCDYQHYWDMGKTYSKEYVRSEAIHTIDSLYKLFPNLRSFSSWYDEFRKRFPGDTEKLGTTYDVNGKEVPNE